MDQAAQQAKVVSIMSVRQGASAPEIIWQPECIALNNQAMSHQEMLRLALHAFSRGDLPEAERKCRTVLSQNGQEPLAMHVLAMVGMLVGQVGPALELFARASSAQPDNADFHANFAHALNQVSRHADAAEWCGRALRVRPDHAQAHKVLGFALSPQTRLVEATESFRRAINFNPRDPESHAGLAIALAERGCIEEALSSYRLALEINPRLAVVHSNLLYLLFYHPGLGPLQIAAEHHRWGALHSAGLGKAAAIRSSAKSDRRLRIGYVSGDFHDHPVGRFISPVLESHDKNKFEVFAYSNGMGTGDGVTERIQNAVDRWCVVAWQNDESVAGRIREDGIDVLVDLSGHSARGRPLLFARKPAPVQVGYLGYPGTAGLAAVDWRLTDSFCDPQGRTEAWHSERLARLEETFLCFRPPANCPVAADHPPLVHSGRVTFGCFNILKKVNAPMVEDWSEILRRVPESRLILKCQAFGDPGVCQEVLSWFERRSIGSERVHLKHWTPTASQHLSAYDEIDIALDTLPYSGTTTTCEALWMGVPVVTRAGDAHVSRVSASLLRCVGLPEFAGGTRQDYVDIAVRLAGDRSRLTELRRSLRARMLASPLMNAERLTRSLERAFREMWTNWCDSATGRVSNS